MCSVRLIGGGFALGQGTASYLLRGKEAPRGETGLLPVPLGNTDREGLPISGRGDICSAQ